MIKFFSILAILLSMMATSAKAETFIEGLEDIPLMEGLKQIPNDSISFGNEESRLVEVYLKAGKKRFTQVEKFYKETLPQMGWKYQGKRNHTLVFYREGESIDIAPEGTSPLIIRITVKNRI